MFQNESGLFRRRHFSGKNDRWESHCLLIQSEPNRNVDMGGGRHSGNASRLKRPGSHGGDSRLIQNSHAGAAFEGDLDRPPLRAHQHVQDHESLLFQAARFIRVSGLRIAAIAGGGIAPATGSRASTRRSGLLGGGRLCSRGRWPGGFACDLFCNGSRGCLTMGSGVRRRHRSWQRRCKRGRRSGFWRGLRCFFSSGLRRCCHFRFRRGCGVRISPNRIWRRRFGS